MPEQEQPTPDENSTEQEAAAPARRSGLLSKLSIVLFLAVVVATECVVAYLCIPTPAQTAEMAKIPASRNSPTDLLFDPEERGKGTDPENQMEVDLGSFSLTAYQPATNATLRIDFQLYGTIDADNSTKFDEAIARSEHRVRDQVIVTIRSSDLEDFTEAGLGLIKSRILAKTNAILGEPLLESVFFSKFSFMEV